MKYILYLISFAVLFIIWRLLSFLINTKKRDIKINQKLHPLIKNLNNNKKPSSELIKKLSDDPLTREDAFLLLKYHKKEKLFPNKYNNQSSLSESKLVKYLFHPNEIGSIVDRIEFVKEVSFSKDEKYFIYKYQYDNKPDWYIGISGSKVFSSGNIFSDQAIKKELEFVRK